MSHLLSSQEITMFNELFLADDEVLANENVCQHNLADLENTLAEARVHVFNPKLITTKLEQAITILNNIMSHDTNSPRLS